MKVSEAPRAGRYPDPAEGAMLRWWDGSDWSERFRAHPDDAQPTSPDMSGGNSSHGDNVSYGQVPAATAAIVDQVRMAARAEAERAAEDFTRRAREITGTIPPLVSQYTNRFLRLFRVGMVLVLLGVLAWVVYQVYIQKEIFDWIGDRIDDLTEQSGNLLSRRNR